jgi:hypothetical protein
MNTDVQLNSTTITGFGRASLSALAWNSLRKKRRGSTLIESYVDGPQTRFPNRTSSRLITSVRPISCLASRSSLDVMSAPSNAAVIFQFPVTLPDCPSAAAARIGMVAKASMAMFRTNVLYCIAGKGWRIWSPYLMAFAGFSLRRNGALSSARLMISPGAMTYFFFPFFVMLTLIIVEMLFAAPAKSPRLTYP